MVAEPNRDDERAGGLTLRYEGVLTVALELASMGTEWMAPMTPLMTSMAPIASLASMVASMDLMMVLLASMVASLVWLRLITKPKTDGKRDDGLIQKICEERADELTDTIGEEGADELTLKSDGERVERLTHKIREERADGLTHKSCEERARLTHNISEERADGFTQRLVGDDGSESGGCRWTNTSTTSRLRRTQRKFESSSALDCVRCEKTWLRMAQVTH